MVVWPVMHGHYMDSKYINVVAVWTVASNVVVMWTVIGLYNIEFSFVDGCMTSS